MHGWVTETRGSSRLMSVDYYLLSGVQAHGDTDKVGISPTEVAIPSPSFPELAGWWTYAPHGHLQYQRSDTSHHCDAGR